MRIIVVSAMFFALSKIIGFFGYASNLLVAMGMLGIILLVIRWQRAGHTLIAASLICLVVLGLSPLGNFLMLSLTERFPAWQSDGRDPDGIIVLGGGIDADVSAARPGIELTSAAERIVAMLELARRYPNARVVFSGGSGNLFPDSPPEAPYARQLMETFGERGDRLLVEQNSRTTYENATFAKALVSPRPEEQWLLVTSAFHMPRSIGAFRQAGFNVVAFPVDWRIEAGNGAFKTFNRVSQGLSLADIAVHEWIGLVAYRITGKSSAFLPKP